jgi:hypothetical protein
MTEKMKSKSARAEYRFIKPTEKELQRDLARFAEVSKHIEEYVVRQTGSH